MQKAIMNRVFIKPDAQKKGVIIIEDDDKTKSGIVVSVGEDVKSVKAGDHVVFYEWEPVPALDGILVIREKFLLGLIENE